MHYLNPYTIRLCFLSAFLSLFSTQTFCAQTCEKDPIHITADEIVLQNNDNKAIATGDVKIKRGDSTLFAKRVEVYFSKKDNKHEIDVLKAFGSVKIVSPETTAKGDKGVYTLATEEITLEGNVDVIDSKKNRVQGTYGTMNQKTGVTKVLNHRPGDKKSKKNGRVSAFLMPQES